MEKNLLTPRYRVENPYPEMGRHNVKVGDILTDNGKDCVRNQNGDAIVAFEWETFPNIFRPLPWWEGRKVEEMPEYIIGKHQGEDNYVKVNKWFQGDSYPITTVDGITYYAPYSTPITEQQYTTYINQKQIQ